MYSPQPQQQPGGFPQGNQWYGPQPYGYNMPPKRANGATTMAAAVLGMLLGGAIMIMAVLTLAVMLGNLDNLNTTRTIMLVAFVVAAIGAVLSLIGAILLTLRKRSSRILLLVGLALILLFAGCGLVQPRVPLIPHGLLSILIILLVIVTVVFAVLPPTSAYLAEARQAVGPPMMGGYGPPIDYGQQPGSYPQQGQYPPQQYQGPIQ